MSYPSMSGYYNSSAQSSRNTNNDSLPPSSSRNANESMYSGSMNNTSNSTNPTSYNSSGYGWTSQSSYSNAAPAEQPSEQYPQSSDCNYQRSNTYGTQTNSSMNDPYSQGYYGRAPLGQSQHSAHNRTEGLSNLAYASGLELATSRSSTRNAPPYEAPASLQQNRMRSPVESQTRYSVNPPAPASSYAMRQQDSSSSISSNQLAMEAAAALAGAVGRRNADSMQQDNLGSTRESPVFTNARSTVSSVPGTSSLQTNTPSRSQQSYVLSQSQQQQQQQPRQRTPAQHERSSSHSTSRRLPAAPSANAQSQQMNTTQESQNRYNTRSSPRAVRHAGSIAHLVTAAYETEPDRRSQSSEVQEVAPNFIDPTSIFDPYAQERERRRQAAECAAIEAKRQAEEDAKRQAAEAHIEEMRKRKQKQKEAAEAAELKRTQDEAATQKRQATRPAQSNTGSARKSKDTAPSITPGPQSEEERMAAELKAMMEKMKAFQTKDPSLFKKLWDDMRKPGPITAATSVDTPSPQPVQRSLPAVDARPQIAAPAPALVPAFIPAPVSAPAPTPDASADQPAKNKSRRRSRKPQTGADGQALHLNGYAVVVENNPEGLSDLGRFPAERRIRQAYARQRPSGGVDELNGTGDQGSTSSPPPAVQAARTPANKAKTPSAKALKSTPAALSRMFPSLSDTPTHPVPSAGSSSGTIWPVEKRDALTSTAMKAFRSNPENLTIRFTEEDLHVILESNPSYIDLCQQLEARGLKFHRGHFARELLNSVPDLKGGAPSSHPTPSKGPPSTLPVSAGTSGTLAQGPPAVPPPPQSQATHLYQQPYPVQHASGLPPTYVTEPYGPSGSGYTQPSYGFGVMYPPGQVPRPFSYPAVAKSAGFPARPEPPPGSKEAAARKRDFSELIDLTELGDDDNYAVPDKYPRLEGPDSGDEMVVDTFQGYQKQSRTITLASNAQAGRFPQPPLPLQHNGHYTQLGQPPMRETIADPKSQGSLLAKPLNKEEGLKKQYYDPKTVARDLLIATGRHPSERPLNVHLAGMLNKYIELDSDVDTFEWDEVDPGGPPIAKVEVGDVPASRPRFKLGERAQRSRKIRPLSIIDKARRPDKEKRVVLPQPATDPPVDDTSDLSSLKDQLRQEPFKKPASKLRHTLLASDEQATPAQVDPTRPPQVQSDRSSRKPPATPKPRMSQDSVPRKRGRPLGSRNKFPSVAGLKAQASDLKIDVPFRDATPATKDKFKCKWKKCSTVLHNLDTLRKHIGRIHRPSSTDVINEGYTCWWKKCKYLKQDENTGDWVTTKVFDQWEGWLKHIEKEHVTPIAMRWGDGPATSHVDVPILLADRKIYLSDLTGLETTPILELTNNNQYPSDTLNLTELDHRVLTTHSMSEKQKTEEAAYIAFMRAHGISVKKHEESREASREVLRSLAKRKEMIGAGIDRGGCTLVNEALREGFVQNPGIRRIVGINE